MILENQVTIKKLDDCPLTDEKKTLKLFRLVQNNPITASDLVPYAIDNPDKFAHLCLGWGLSTHNSLEASIKAIKGLSSKKRKKIIAVFSIDIEESIAVKHQSGENKNHYTVYPYENVGFIKKFNLVNNL